MRDPYSLVRPALFRLPVEQAHALALRAIGFGWDKPLVNRVSSEPDSPILGQWLWGLNFQNPVGLAAGFDKDARGFRNLWHWGFGFVEVGTVTPRPQRGNSKPRLFRLDEDRAIINRMGFNSGGLDKAVARLSKHGRPGIVGLNLGKNRDSDDATADYREGILRAAGLADYLVVNISSPNTPGLRDLQARAALDSLLRRLLDTRETTGHQVPLLLKIAPDLTPAECCDIAEVALDTGIDGLIVSNTTVRRPVGMRSRHRGEAGGLSGAPLLAQSTKLLFEMYRLTRGKLPLIGVGGIANAEDAYAKIRAGASLIQIHTALIFQGPRLVSSIKQDLTSLLKRDGFRSITEATGSAHASGTFLRPVAAAEEVGP
ncbi:MAG TPA: quinone-dependent dihydroorotate dehydrogenase [Stellaceae bacterium]|nr:quinone-dependent dihydroorotate dehydrogenase [Stellaceae bacterium]